MQSYESLAACYDALMDDVDYPAWGRYIVSLLQSRGIMRGRILDAACGTGAVTEQLLLARYDVIGLDMSEQMLEHAANRLRKRGFRCQLICRDMCNIDLHHAMDAINCSCDGVNYLTKDADVLRFFKSAYDHLRAGGVLTFDISSAEKLCSMAGQFYAEDRGDIAYIWNNTMTDGILEMDLAFFTRRQDGLYVRTDEMHHQKAHEKKTLIELLKQAGFCDIACYGFGTMEEPKTGDMRIVFIAAKPE